MIAKSRETAAKRAAATIGSSAAIAWRSASAGSRVGSVSAAAAAPSRGSACSSLAPTLANLVLAESAGEGQTAAHAANITPQTKTTQRRCTHRRLSGIPPIGESVQEVFFMSIAALAPRPALSTREASVRVPEP